MTVVTTILRYFWFLVLGLVLFNVRFMQPRLNRLVALGRITEQEANHFLRAVAYGFGIPCLALGLISIWAPWPLPICAGILSFRDIPSAASAIVILATWAALLVWVWAGRGADLLGRIVPALSSPPNWERSYSPAVVRLAITGMLLIAGVGGTLAYRSMPTDGAWPATACDVVGAAP